jgi:hypothetical protein
MGKNDKTGVWPDSLSNGHRINETLGAEGNKIEIDDAPFTKMMKRPEDGIMLKAGLTTWEPGVINPWINVFKASVAL